MRCAPWVRAVLLAAFSVSVNAQQHNCDCTQIVGSCEASLKVEPTGASGSFGAKLTFVSTAPICSKVSYYVDSTPYFNILSRGNTDQDTIFGTKPVTRDTITDVRCQLCKTVASVRPEIGSPNAAQTGTRGSPPSPLQGTWTGRWSWMFFSGTITLTVNVVGDRASGHYQEEGGGGDFQGTVAGSVITGTYARHDGLRGRFTIQLTGQNTATWSAHNPDGRVITADLTR